MWMSKEVQQMLKSRPSHFCILYKLNDDGNLRQEISYY